MNHSINIAAKRSGLTTHVIRVWEKRYGAIAPIRTETNRRQYSDEEINRLLLLKRATDAGHKISEIVPLSTENLAALLAKDEILQAEQIRDPRTTEGDETERGRPHIKNCLEAIKTLNSNRLEETLTQAALLLGHQGMICHVVSPLTVQIGKQWREGSITAAHEHFASAIIRVFLTNISKPFAIPESAPRIIVATPAGQLHELGAIIASATCASAGWRATYLGTNLPAAEISGACLQNQAQAVALSIVFPEDDPDLAEELQRLRAFLPQEVHIIIGGRAAPAYRQTLDKIDARICTDIKDLSHTLDTLRTPTS
jgi:DNA-binding transcriptional MerR regulator/methylmalonyl-CoA mutase cobalamin-binding subunit